MKLSLKCAVFALFITFSSFAQELVRTTLNGTVKTADGKPAEFINVSVEGLSMGATTDASGDFVIKNLKPGNYTLNFSFVGLKSRQVMVEINDRTIVTIPTITLEESSQQLQEVIVVSERLNQFAQKETDFVSRLPLKNLENPQSYSVVTSALMKEQLTTDIVSSLKSITAGGSVQSNDGNATMYLRGFRSDAYVRNGMVSHVRLPVDPANIERIEVIKGPSSTLFGANISNISAYGGVINRVTKRPKAGKSFEAGYTTGSFDLNRFTVDYNTSINNDNSLLFRVNAAAHSENTFQDQGFQRNLMIAPSLKYIASDRLSFFVDAEYYKTKRTLFFARGVSGVTGATFEDLKLDYNKSYTSNDMAANMSSLSFSGGMEYKLGNWTSKTSFATSTIDVSGEYFRLDVLNDNLAVRKYIQFDPRNTGSTQVQQDFIGVHSLGSVENKILVGGSYLKLYDDVQRGGFMGPFIPYDTLKFNNLPLTIPAVQKNKFDAFVASKSFTQQITGQQVLGVYITDVVKIAERINVLAGLRFDRFFVNNTQTNGIEGKDGYTQNTLSPKLGLVYSPINDRVSVFANYMNGFTNQAPAIGESQQLENFDPEQANQWEAGVKLNLLNGKLLSTISYYDIEVSDKIRNITTSTSSYSVQDGSQTSKGFEVDVIANPLPGLNLLAGYTFNKSEYVKVSVEAVQGKRPTYTPEQMANFWISYRSLRGVTKGIGAGFGGNYVSEIFINDMNTFSAPSYTTFDGTIFYDQLKYRIGLKVDNLGDKKYWNAYGIPQKPRNFLISLNIKL